MKKSSRQKEELVELDFLNNESDTRCKKIEKLKRMLNIIKEVVYCGGAPIADEVIEKYPQRR